MAELGVIASIVGIAGVGIKLSKTLFEIGDKAVSADRNLHRLATNVSLFAQTLKHFAEVMRANENLYSPEFEETSNQILDECHNIFNDLTQRAVMARKFVPGSNFTLNMSKSPKSLMHKVKEYFEKSKVDWLLAQLEYLKTTLSVLIQTLQLAAVTANAKKGSEELTKANEEKIEREKVHIETLIIARQLSFLVVLQQNHQQAETAKAAGSGVIEEVASVSPVESDDSIEEIHTQKLLTATPANTTSLVELGRGNLKFLDDVIPRQPELEFPTLNPAHNQIIDQLLGRWTRLPEIEEEINKAKRRDTKDTIDLEEQALPPYSAGSIKSVTDSTTKPDIPTPDLKLPLLDLHDAARAVPEPVAVNMVSVPVTNLDPQATQVPRPSRTPPPPLVTHTTYSGVPDSLNPSVSDSPTLYRTVSSPEPEMHTPQHQQMRALSPQPGNTYNPPQPQPPRNIIPTSAPLDWNANPPPPPPPISPRVSFSPTSSQLPSSRPGSSHQSVPRGQSGPAVSPSGSLYDSSPDSELDEDSRNRRLGLGIPWRIRIGPKYWDFLDERLVGPRTPYLPKEPMSYLYSHDFAETEIAEKWVCEEAIKEKNYSYGTGKGEDQAEARWRIKSPLKFQEVDDLVERTIDIYRRKTTAYQPEPSGPRSTDGTRATQPVPIPTNYAPPYPSNGPQPPPPPPPPPQQLQQQQQQMPQDPAARTRTDNLNTWLQMNNSQQQRSQQQYSRSYQGPDGSGVPLPPPPPRPGNMRPEYPGMAPASMGQEARIPYWDYPPARSVAGGPPPQPPPSVAGTAGSAAIPPGPPYGYPPYQPGGARDVRAGYDGDDYDRHKRRSRDKRKKRSSAATVAKVSGLMAVLDSLDAAF